MDQADTPDWMTPEGAGWRTRSERLVYDNPWIRLNELQAEAPTGAQTVYGLIHFKNQAIGVLPLHEDGTVTLVGQHRLPCADYSWEIPEGGAPVGTDPLEGARRELKEETGLEASDWREVMRFQLSNSVTDEHGVGYIAMGLTQAEAEPDATEALAVARVPFAEALDQTLCGRIRDMITLAMLLRAYHMAREGLLPEPVARSMLAGSLQRRGGETP